jgi:starch synthase
MAIREVAHTTAHDGGPSPKLLAGLSRVVVPIDPSHDHRLPRAAMSSIGLEEALFSPEGVEFYGEVPLTKAGAIGADRVIALGESPRASLSKPGASHRLDGVYRARGADVLSIGSGVDQAQYNPATDPQLAMRYDPEDLANKARARSSVLTELELETSATLPLLLVIGPIDASAEVALAAAVDRALRGELLIAAVSAAPKRDDSPLEKLCRTHKGRIAVRSSATETFLHRALAAADFALVLDDKSATGTAPRAAMRYGTLPIAPRSPAMEEAIVDVEASLATGTGFLAPGATESDLFGVIQRAVSAFEHPAFAKLRRRAMRMEGGWERAARRLAAILEALEA